MIQAVDLGEPIYRRKVKQGSAAKSDEEQARARLKVCCG
jgi:hypothetical protein